MSDFKYPKIIFGGMGIYISDWKFTNTVSRLGQQGTLSGVVLERIMVNLLQMGDIGGHIRRALSNFPFPHISKMVLNEYYVEGGLKKGTVPKKAQMFSVKPSELLISLTVCANYAFVWLSKEGHKNPVSINYLEKIAMPHLYAIFGAMLAGIDLITMGAGIPLQIPKVIDSYIIGEEAKYSVPVIGKNITSYMMSFNPSQFFGKELKDFLPLKRPGFIPIISSNILAAILVKKLPEGSIYGFGVEENVAGGHNAPPRNKISYGVRDRVDYIELAEIGLPFWIGGSYASPEKLKWACSVGAKGIQVGSIGALSEDSGMNSEIRRKARYLGWLGKLKVRTDMRISPSGFPFKVAILDGTISEQDIYKARQRVCNCGALMSLYEKSDGTIGYRCEAEPVDVYVWKGGNIEDTVGRGCLCNGLLSNAGHPCGNELPVLTLGDDVSFLKEVMDDPYDSYNVSDAINYLLGKV